MDQRVVLKDTLTQIGRSELPDPLERSYCALRAVVRYVDSDFGLSLQEHMAPLHALINALSDTLKGSQSEMLRPRHRGKGPPKDLSFSSVQGTLAGALDVLIRVGTPSDSAARRIEAQADSLKIRDRKGQRVTAKQVIDWRARAKDDLPAAATAAFKRVTAPDIADQDEAKLYARDVLLALVSRGHGRDRNSE